MEEKMNNKEQIVYKKVKDLKLNEKNPRKNDGAVDGVAKSIEKYGFKNPLIIDSNNVVWCGNTRLKASKKLGLKEVPCIIADDLTEEQIREYALLDNKLNEIAEWDYELLSEELSVLDLEEFDLDWGIQEIINEEDINNNTEDNPYTMKVDIPQYQIKGECPELKELIDLDKVKQLEKDIKNANITKEQKEFLINATKRHLVFNYSKIAEYYAHQDKEMQELMEKSALVIIDFNDAIKNGFVEIRKEIEALYSEEDDEEE
jgi:hypothetical protein